MSTTKKQPDYHSLLKRALTTIGDLQKKLDRETRLKNEPIAIIGLGCRFPGGANDPETFWQLLSEGFDAVRDIPEDRWDADAHFDPAPGTPGKMYVKQAAFLDEVGEFDPQFFGIAPREAVSMDPQQRLLLEVTWEALEHAAQAPRDLKGSRTGVFIGISSTDYAHLQAKSGMAEAIDTYFGAGWAHSMATGRISYLLGLQGPSMAVDTACSASLLATHLAVQSLRTGESEMAIAGGVNLILAPDGITTAAQAKMLSPDGRCKTFDDSANGYVRGEGCGIIVLKRLSDALKNRDNVLAVISGSAANQDGKSSGVTAPNGLAQEAVIREALQNANRKPGEISYIETHGTGTSLGDPIEVRSLNNVFGKDRSPENALKIGSVKTNVGHLEAAAGIAGLIKTVLALRHKQIPPHLHFQTPNHHIPWEHMPISVPVQIAPWQNDNQPCVAGLSSFGFSGTNVHLVIEEYSPKVAERWSERSGAERSGHVLCLSARSEAALKEVSNRYVEALSAKGASHSPFGRGQGWVNKAGATSEDSTLKRGLQTMGDICFSANAGRAHHPHRLALIGRSEEEFLEKLKKFTTGEAASGLHGGVFEKSEAPEMVFLFTGQGAQYAGMAKRLYETQPTFRKVLDRCAGILEGYLEKPLLEVVFAANDSPLEGGQGGVKKRSQHSKMPENIPLTPFEGGMTGASKTHSDSPFRRWAGGDVSERAENLGTLDKPTPNPSLDEAEAVQKYKNAPVLPFPRRRESISRAKSTDSRLRGNDVEIDVLGRRQDLINQTAYTQPALFAVEYALARLWMSWGVRPAAVTGHSVGEYVAACVAGVFSLEDGLKLIAARGRLMQALPRNGGMVSIFTGAETVRRAIAGYENSVSIAAFNGAENTVISGEQTAINAILESLEKEEIKYKKLTVSHAFHSPLMAPMLDEFERIAGEITFHEPRIALISNVSGKMETGGFFSNAAYWREHVRAAVNFHASINWLHAQGYRHFLEIGPHPTLSGMGARCVAGDDCHWLPSLRRGAEDWSILLESLAKLYVRGVDIDWKKFDAGYARRRVVLPTYPFQRARYWVKAAKVGAWNPAVPPEMASRGEIVHPLLGAKLRSPLESVQFESVISVKKTPFLRDHRFYGKAVFPATGYFELMLAAVRNVLGESAFSLKNIEIRDALFVPDDDVVLMQTLIENDENGRRNLRILSLKNGKWQLHASAFLEQKNEHSTAANTLEEAQTRCTEAFDREAYYQRFEEMGVTYGEAFQGIQNLKYGENEALARVHLPDSVSDADFLAHPALLDACVQLIGAALLGSNEDETETNVYMPVGLESLVLFEKLPRNVRAHAKIQGRESALLTGDLTIYAESGETLAALKNMRFKRVRPELLASVDEVQKDWLYEVVWRKRALAEVRKNGALKKNWLIFADDGGVGEKLAQALIKGGSTCTTIHRGAKIRRNDRGNRALDLDDVPGFDEILRPFQNDFGTSIGYFWGIDEAFSADASADDLMAAQRRICGGALRLVQSCLAHEAFAPSRLWFFTRGAQTIDSAETLSNPSQAALWGFAGTVMQEQPSLRCGVIDLDEKIRTEALAFELQQNENEDRVALRNGGRFVARVQRIGAKAGEIGNQDENVYLNFSERGTLDNLRFETRERRRPEPNEVEIRVRATGLNFRDVLNVLGMYPGEAGGLGQECAGEVAAVGENVTEFKIGDEAVALAGDSFAKFITVGEQYVVPKPANLSFSEAATIPVTFLTAHFALRHLGKMKKGDRVLIHAAAGGVGLAAVQLAQNAGAEIFATASPPKWDYLKSLGVKNVMNSRTLDFAEEIMTATHGEGVDFVLNSLIGDFITKSLEVLRDGGRFLEIGRTELLDDERLAALGKKIHYDVIYLGENILENPALICGMLRDLLKNFESGDLKPLRQEAFPLEKAQDAFRRMAQAKHIGKVVLTQI